MADISSEVLRKEIEIILKNADLSVTSAKNVRMELEEKFNINLLSRRLEINKLCMEFINANKQEPIEKIQKELEDSDSESDEEQSMSYTAFLNVADLSSMSIKKIELALQEKLHTNLQLRKKKIYNPFVGYIDAIGCEEENDFENNKRKNESSTGEEPAAKESKKTSDEESEDTDDEWTKSKQKGYCDAITEGSGYVKPMTLSPELAALVGRDSMPRHEVVKKIWAIIKEKNLYDPHFKQYAICDDALMKVIGVKRFRTFGIMKYLRNHFIR